MLKTLKTCHPHQDALGSSLRSNLEPSIDIFGTNHLTETLALGENMLGDWSQFAWNGGGA